MSGNNEQALGDQIFTHYRCKFCSFVRPTALNYDTIVLINSSNRRDFMSFQNFRNMILTGIRYCAIIIFDNFSGTGFVNQKLHRATLCVFGSNTVPFFLFFVPPPGVGTLWPAILMNGKFRFCCPAPPMNAWRGLGSFSRRSARLPRAGAQAIQAQPFGRSSIMPILNFCARLPSSSSRKIKSLREFAQAPSYRTRGVVNRYDPAHFCVSYFS